MLIICIKCKKAFVGKKTQGQICPDCLIEEYQRSLPKKKKEKDERTNNQKN